MTFVLPLTSKAVTFGILVGMIPMLGALAWGATLSHADVERGHWAIAAVLGLALGQWGGQKLARRLLGQTAVLDLEARLVRVGTRILPFAEVTAVTLEFEERHVRRAGQMLFASIVVATRAERILFVHRAADPSQRKEVAAALRPVAKNLARSLGRQLD